MYDDLLNLSVEEARERILAIRADLRRHRDQVGDDRCMFDDYWVYRHVSGLPDHPPKELPPPEKRRQLCTHFYEYRRDPEDSRPLPREKYPQGPKPLDEDVEKHKEDLVWLLGELAKMRIAITMHYYIAFKSGRRLTWKDDCALFYALLPDGINPNFWLPDRDTFLNGWGESGGCSHFWRSHKSCPTEVHNLHEWGPCGTK